MFSSPKSAHTPEVGTLVNYFTYFNEIWMCYHLRVTFKPVKFFVWIITIFVYLGILWYFYYCWGLLLLDLEFLAEAFSLGIFSILHLFLLPWNCDAQSAVILLVIPGTRWEHFYGCFQGFLNFAFHISMIWWCTTFWGMPSSLTACWHF